MPITVEPPFVQHNRTNSRERELTSSYYLDPIAALSNPASEFDSKEDRWHDVDEHKQAPSLGERSLSEADFETRHSCRSSIDGLDGNSVVGSTISGSASALSCMHIPEQERTRSSQQVLEFNIDLAELREQEDNLRAVYENTVFDDLCASSYEFSEPMSDHTPCDVASSSARQTTSSSSHLSQSNIPRVDMLQVFLRNLRDHCPEPPSEDARSSRSQCQDDNCNCRLNASVDLDAHPVGFTGTRGHRNNRSVSEQESLGCVSESRLSVCSGVASSLVSDAELQRT